MFGTGFAPPAGSGGFSTSQDGQALMTGGAAGYPQPDPYATGGGYPPPGGYPSNAPQSALSKIQKTTSMNLVFFAAACCIMVGSFISGICLFLSGQLADSMETIYLMLFGGILAVLDTPFFRQFKGVGDMKMYIGKYANILTRVTGKGLVFLFLGAALFSSMWTNLKSGFLLFLAIFLCIFPVLVGLAAIVIGVMKSQKLQRARQHLVNAAPEQWYDQLAQTYRGPEGGLTPTEFNELTTKNGGIKWEGEDLKLIFNALVSNPVWRIVTPPPSQGGTNRPAVEDAKMPKEDMMSWIQGGMVWL